MLELLTLVGQLESRLTGGVAHFVALLRVSTTTSSLPIASKTMKRPSSEFFEMEEQRGGYDCSS